MQRKRRKDYNILIQLTAEKEADKTVINQINKESENMKVNYDRNKSKAIDFVIDGVLDVDISIPQVLKGSNKV